MKPPKPIRVLIVDDSAIVRQAVTRSLQSDPEIEVVGAAVDPYVARDKILTLNPDVLTLDIEMPRMDGLTFLKIIMKHRPMPVVVMSSLTQSGSAKALEALQAGAVDVMEKPGGSFSAFDNGLELARKIKAAASARIRPADVTMHPVATQQVVPPSTAVPAAGLSARQVILMGASTGGTEALKRILLGLPCHLPGICIVQHIPAQFSLAFANRLNELCALEVREAKCGDAVRPGTALIAPGGFHLLLHWSAGGYRVRLSDGPRVHHQRPAVDVLFQSAERAGAAPHSVGVLLTGMGADGAAGLLALHKGGAATIAQDEASCVVFGMPREAIRMGAAGHVLPLDRIGEGIQQQVRRMAAAAQNRRPSAGISTA